MNELSMSNIYLPISDFKSDVTNNPKLKTNCSGEDGYLKVDSPFWSRTIELKRGIKEDKRECSWFIDMGKFSEKGYLNITINDFNVSTTAKYTNSSIHSGIFITGNHV